MTVTDHEVEVKGMGLGQAAATLVTVAAQQGYDVTASGPNRFRLDRALRPWWANVLAIVLAPLLGLGLLLLRVRRVETCEGIILEERGAVRVNLGGLQDPGLFLALHTALLEQGAKPTGGLRPTAYPSAAPPPPPPSTAAPTPAPAASPPPSHLAPPSHPAPPSNPAPQFDQTLTIAQLAKMRSREAPALRFPDGRVVPVGAGVVIGRSPEPDEDLPSAELLALGDASLSKSHASIGPGTHGLWVEDLGSTNGTVVVVGASSTRCQPGARVNVPIGGAVLLGEVRLDVVAGGA